MELLEPARRVDRANVPAEARRGYFYRNSASENLFFFYLYTIANPFSRFCCATGISFSEFSI
ncbi:hypothetical protein [Parapedobacter sp. 10938]|uniref:hypothetical protein n=1 Tax=Parapedobacter flavus TaxID=3110225 RepID=UPI002DBB3A08|nr:hypothetical protein [Parapedobacter sp. 10938]MEC3879748.1 hypothetical protein [Parapedobacter sp. 10938]